MLSSDSGMMLSCCAALPALPALPASMMIKLYDCPAFQVHFYCYTTILLSVGTFLWATGLHIRKVIKRPLWRARSAAHGIKKQSVPLQVA